MQEAISPTTVETVYLSSELGQFEIEPLESGFGLTIGNALRRVLLSSLTGAAITAIKIDNVYHEFSMIPGVREDTTELILNLKQVRLKSYTEDPVTVRLETSGPGLVTAGDIQVPPEIEVVNPETPVATLDSDDARLDMMLTIERGRGYITADGREALTIGVIPIDAVFTPVRRVNYRVEKTRVGARTDYDKLILEIQTDGTIGPAEALGQAATILIDHFQIFSALGGDLGRLEKPAVGVGAIPPRLQDMPIEVLDLSSRTYNCLKRSQITTVGQLLQMSEEELLGLRNFGQKSLQELHEKLMEHGITTGEAGESGVAFVVADEDLEREEEEEEVEVETAAEVAELPEELGEEEYADDFEEEVVRERGLARARGHRGRPHDDDAGERRRR